MSNAFNCTNDIRTLDRKLLKVRDCLLVLYLTCPEPHYPSFLCSPKYLLSTKDFPGVRLCAGSENTGLNRRHEWLPHGVAIQSKEVNAQKVHKFGEEK